MIKERFIEHTLDFYYPILWLDKIAATPTFRPITESIIKVKCVN